MAAVNRYRWVVIFMAFGVTILMHISLIFLAISFMEHRLVDFRHATMIPDFNTDWTNIMASKKDRAVNIADGTYFEVISHDQLKDGTHKFSEPEHESWKCEEELGVYIQDEGDIHKMNNALEVSVHAIYARYRDKTEYQNDATKRVMYAGLNKIVGSSDLASGPLEQDTHIWVNYTDISTALMTLGYPEVDIGSGNPGPLTSCKQVYPDGVWDPAYYNHLTQLDGLTRITTDLDIKCRPITVTGWHANLNAGTHTPAAGTIIDHTALTQVQKNRLYTHCKTQFRFAGSGTYLDNGTFGVPLAGVPAGPAGGLTDVGLFPFQAEGFNSSLTDYDTRARMLLGLRFGWSLWALVPLTLTAAFLLGDSVIFWLAEATAPTTIIEKLAAAPNMRAESISSYVNLATSAGMRGRRLFVALILYIASFILWITQVIVPWGLNEQSLGRPICEAGDHGQSDDHPNMAFIHSYGGWKPNWEPVWWEIYVVILEGISVLILPIATAGFFNSCKRCFVGTQISRVKLQANTTGWVPIRTDSFFYQYFLFPILAIGTLVILSGQVYTAMVMGMAWADGVVNVAERNQFIPKQIYEHLFDNLVAVAAIVVGTGFIMGTTGSRWLLNRQSRSSFLIFLVWILLTGAGFLIVLIVATIRTGDLFDEDEQSKDCAEIFSEAVELKGVRNLGDRRFACTWRWISLIIGFGMIIAAFAYMALYGCLRKCRGLCSVTRRKDMDTSTAMATPEVNSVIDSRFASQLNDQARPGSFVDESQVSLLNNAYNRNNAKSDFFKFTTRATPSAAVVPEPFASSKKARANVKFSIPVYASRR